MEDAFGASAFYFSSFLPSGLSRLFSGHFGLGFERISPAARSGRQGVGSVCFPRRWTAVKSEVPPSVLPVHNIPLGQEGGPGDRSGAGVVATILPDGLPGLYCSSGGSIGHDGRWSNYILFSHCFFVTTFCTISIIFNFIHF